MIDNGYKGYLKVYREVFEILTGNSHKKGLYRLLKLANSSLNEVYTNIY